MNNLLGQLFPHAFDDVCPDQRNSFFPPAYSNVFIKKRERKFYSTINYILNKRKNNAEFIKVKEKTY